MTKTRCADLSHKLAQPGTDCLIYYLQAYYDADAAGQQSGGSATLAPSGSTTDPSASASTSTLPRLPFLPPKPATSLAPPSSGITPAPTTYSNGSQQGIGTFISPLGGQVSTGSLMGGPQMDALFIAELAWVSLPGVCMFCSSRASADP